MSRISAILMGITGGMIGAASPAFAEAALSLSLDMGQEAQIISAQYSCDGGAPFDVQYINTEANILAVIPIDGQGRVFVNVISGSGARYVSGIYEWWSKGDDATLTDQTAPQDARNCAVVPAPSQE